ncbi:secretin N-terminal domain-containing protein [Stutzerimonas kirkiae]|uniref:secretin N-terminal domain-containing protein n=1 Tax=Stutzerimonas kirkiae TaxID=2211392 RepID=UPI0010382E50|nr:secretin N-terminal domain-containing protein [Stutzerimonas kirkiae]TBV09640.1 secretin [Stutzerimonas kirkiae]
MATLRNILVSLFLLACLPVQADTEIITLNFRLGEQLLPVAQSLIGERGKVTAHENQLIVSAPAEAIGELREVLVQLDREPRRLLISVDSQDRALRGDGDYRTLDDIHADDDMQRPPSDGPATTRIIRRQTLGNGTGIRRIQATEGHPALIQTGQIVPLESTTTDAYGRLQQQTHYHELVNGFYATAYVIGNRVEVTLETRRDSLAGQQTNRIETRDSSTRIGGNLGEWISIAEVDESGDSGQAPGNRRYSTEGPRNLGLRLKVDILQ